MNKLLLYGTEQDLKIALKADSFFKYTTNTDKIEIHLVSELEKIFIYRNNITIYGCSIAKYKFEVFWEWKPCDL